MKKRKIFLALALMTAFGSSLFAQADTHSVSTNLTETRTLSVTGNSSIAIARNPAVAWISDNSSQITINHDLLITQKITVGVVSAAPWTNRWLRVNGANGGGAGYAWNAHITPATIIQRDLVISGAIQPPADFITGIVATGGPSNPLTLTYDARAGVSAVTGLNSADVTYTLMDQ